MTNRCVSCNQFSEVGSLVTNGGAAYFLCDKCPIEPVQQEKLEGWFIKNIREAKERRASGQSMWRGTNKNGAI